jgi:hypothetical protein
MFSLVAPFVGFLQILLDFQQSIDNGHGISSVARVTNPIEKF